MGELARESAPKAHDTLYGESGSVEYWLASAWTLDDIAAEWDWLFEDKPPSERLRQMWLRPRWTTEAERADEDTLYDLFGDGYENANTSVYYDSARPESPGAHLYLTVA